MNSSNQQNKLFTQAPLIDWTVSDKMITFNGRYKKAKNKKYWRLKEHHNEKNYSRYDFSLCIDFRFS